MIQVIEPLKHADVLPFARLAARDHVSLKDTRQPTRWYGSRNAEGAVVLVGGLLLMGNRRARIRGVWCDPNYRGRGWSAALMDRLVNEARDHGCLWMTQLAASPRWWIEQRQWHLVRQLPNGRAWIEKFV